MEEEWVAACSLGDFVENKEVIDQDTVPGTPILKHCYTVERSIALSFPFLSNLFR